MNKVSGVSSAYKDISIFLTFTCLAFQVTHVHLLLCSLGRSQCRFAVVLTCAEAVWDLCLSLGGVCCCARTEGGGRVILAVELNWGLSLHIDGFADTRLRLGLMTWWFPALSAVDTLVKLLR